MTDVYASRDELKAAIGGGAAGAGGDTDRMDAALIAGTWWVQHRVGVETTDDEALEAPYDLEVIAVRPSWKLACLAASIRFFNSPLVPFGVAGVGEYGMTVRTAIPEADAVLLGQRESFGFA